MEALELEIEEMDNLVGNRSLQDLEDDSLCFVRNRKRYVSIAAIVTLVIVALLAKGSPNGGRDIGAEEREDIQLMNTLIVVDEKREGNEEAEQAAETHGEVADDAQEKPPRKTLQIPPIQLDRDQLPIDEKQNAELIEKWGQWHFWDGDEEMRPKEDYCAKYPNRDIPGDNFPAAAWQVDAVYVNHYLNDADKMISRAMEAIFTEYGKGKPLAPEKLAERVKMFHLEKLDLAETTKPPPMFAKRGNREIGGWTTKRSFDGLVRRLLHAMLTEDSFTIVLAGHSAAQGQGNHFRQSYMMQAYKILRPIFERLGVKLVTRNISQGGLGTMQGAMGSAGIYGDEIDLMIWDSGMTENQLPPHIDLFLRQALIGGKRVPAVWGGNFELLRMLHEEADADVGEFGFGTADMPVTESEEQMKSLPWAYQKMKCPADRDDLYNSDRFSATCWIDRPDGVKPKTPQLDRPRGQVKWHPGWRAHQLVGRTIAFVVLEGLQVAINTWSEATMSGQPLDEDYWHVTDYYENIRNKVLNLDSKLGACYEIDGTLPTRMCNTPMQGRTQYTPRAHPEERSLSALVKPASDGYVPRNEKVALYDAPDVHIPDFDVPEGAIDVLAILENRRQLKGSVAESNLHVKSLETNKSSIPASTQSSRSLDNIVPGKGWQVFDEPQGTCDGSYESVCGRSTDNDCILIGHHDGRGAVIGNEYAGWLVLQLKDLKEGILVVKLHTWHYDSENTRTAGWKAVNNEAKNSQRQLRVSEPDDGVDASNVQDDWDRDWHLGYDESLEHGERSLTRSYSTPDLPETFMFDYAINGKITTLNKTEFLAQKKQVQRVVETLTLLDDKGFSNGKAQTIEVAIRMRGCGRSCVFGVSHIYWA